MGKWTAVSDFDYEDEMNPQRRREPRCPRCGDVMVPVCDSDGRPMWARCESCAPLAQPARDRKSA